MTDEFQPLLTRIGDAFEADLEPVPDHLLDAARSAFAWRLADGALAELLFDSASDELAGVRGGSGTLRSFRYAAGEHMIRVHLTATSLVVMLEPPIVVTCRVATEERSDQHATDEFGELVIEAPRLPVRLEFELPGGVVATPWITV